MTDAELAAARLTALLDAERENTALRIEVARLRGERAAVVAWLRTEVRKMPEVSNKPAWFHVADLADHIERGKHRREEKR